MSKVAKPKKSKLAQRLMMHVCSRHLVEGMETRGLTRTGLFGPLFLNNADLLLIAPFGKKSLKFESKYKNVNSRECI